MTDQNQIRQLEIQIETAQRAVDTMGALIRLQDNKDFNLVINEEYLKDYPLNLVDSLADANLQEPIQQEAIQQSLRGVSELRAYFRTVVQRGRTMEKTIRQSNEEIDRLDDDGESLTNYGE